MITRLASTMRDEFSSIIRTFTSSTVSEANEAALAIINRLVAEKSRTEAENIALRADNERLRAALENPVSDDEHIWIYERAAAMFRDWSRAGVRGQKIYPQDGIEYWTALAMRECLIARAALAAQPAPGGKDE